MRKIFALYSNEITKISKKVSVYILLLVMVVGIAGFAGIVKFSQVQESKHDYQSSDTYKEHMRDDIKRQQEDSKVTINDVTEKLKTASSEDKMILMNDLISAQETIAILDIALEKNINYNANNYLVDSLNEVKRLNIETKMLELMPKEILEKDELAKLEQNKKSVLQYKKILETNNFAEYIALSNEVVKNDISLSEEIKQIKIDGNNLLLKALPNGNAIDDKSNASVLTYAVDGLVSQRTNLLKNVEITDRGETTVLTPERRTAVENDITVKTYNIENGINVSNDSQYPNLALTGMFGVGTFILVILVIILAGGAVSSEMSTGSIKSLIISPTKRWKIYLAKLLSILSVAVVIALIAYAVSMLIFAIMFGVNGGDPYVYASNGIAHELNFYFYRLLNFAVGFIDIIIYLIFALMLSIITKNTAASVGISVATYFGGSMAMNVIYGTGLLKGEWLKFIPFANMSLAGRIFSGDAMQSMGSLAIPTPTLSFSLIYLIVIAICMIYIGLDSFNRKDIK